MRMLTPAGEAQFFFLSQGASLYGMSSVRFFWLWRSVFKPHSGLSSFSYLAAAFAGPRADKRVPGR